jgi:RNA polymerase sigma-70 factor (ECF subfamily)
MSASPVVLGGFESSFASLDEVAAPRRVAPANDCEVQALDRVTALYRKHRLAILARCRRLLRHDSAAEDATQETFLRVVQHARKAPAGDQALAWMYCIATNYCLNQLRNRKAAPTVPLGELACNTRASSVETAVADRDLARKILASVPGEVSAVALLRHVEGMYDAEVAAVLGVGRRTVVYRLEAFKQKAARRVDLAP